jgi:hypothetical protein
VLVDLEEIRGLVRGDDHGGLTPLKVAGALDTTNRVARALIKHGHLKTASVINPINRCRQTVVMPAEVERFQRESTAETVDAPRSQNECVAKLRTTEQLGLSRFVHD